MSNNFFGPGNEDDLWAEFGGEKTSWERKVEILVNLAASYGQKQDWSKEVEFLEIAADMAADHDLKLESYRINNIISARLLRIYGDADEAIRRADMVLNAEPNFVPDEDIIHHVNKALGRKGAALIMLKRYAEAVPLFKALDGYAEMLNDGPEIAHANVALMRCYIELDELENARKVGEKAKSLYQDNSRLGEMLEVDRLFAKIALLVGNYVRAKIDLKEIRLLERRMNQASDVETKLLLGRAYLGLEKYDAAERVLKRAYTSCINGWNMDFDNGLEAGFYLIQALEAQDKHAEAAGVSVERKALSKRAPGVKLRDIEAQDEEAADLLNAGKPELAVVASKNLIALASEKGDIKARWNGFHKMLCGLWRQDDFDGIVSIWDSVSHESLNYQDDVVITIKNMVTHALQKVGRTNEALALCKEVLSDIRAGENPMELLYAKENAARINKELENYREARKLKDEVVKEYLALGCPDRALGLIEYMDKRKKRGPGK